MVSVKENSYVLFSSFSIVNLVNNKLQKNKTDKIFFFFLHWRKLLYPICINSSTSLNPRHNFPFYLCFLVNWKNLEVCIYLEDTTTSISKHTLCSLFSEVFAHGTFFSMASISTRIAIIDKSPSLLKGESLKDKLMQSNQTNLCTTFHFMSKRQEDIYPNHSSKYWLLNALASFTFQFKLQYSRLIESLNIQAFL